MDPLVLAWHKFYTHKQGALLLGNLVLCYVITNKRLTNHLMYWSTNIEMFMKLRYLALAEPRM